MTPQEEAELRKDSVSPSIYTPATVARGGSAQATEAELLTMGQMLALEDALALPWSVVVEGPFRDENEPEEGEWFHATTPEIGVSVTRSTPEQAREWLAHMRGVYLQDFIEKGKPIPKPQGG